MKITKVGYKDENQNPQEARVGEWVEKIEQHYPQGEGDKHYCTIYFKSGTIREVFDLISVDKE